MPIWLIVTLVVISGLTFLPLFELDRYADRKVNWHKYTDNVTWLRKRQLDRTKYWWMPLATVLRAYTLIAIFVWMIPTFMATMSPHILGVSYNDMEKDYPQLAWMFKPLLPLIGPLMLVIAIVIRCFYKPEPTTVSLEEWQHRSWNA